MWTETICYEQPLDEHTRICLKLEHLFEQAFENMDNPSPWGSRLTMEALLEALNVVTRPDLKSKFSKAITIQLGYLDRWRDKPHVDLPRLKKTCAQLQHLHETICHTPQQIGSKLRHHDFLNPIRLQLNNPGGACPFTTPAYQLWLKRSSEERIADLKRWVQEFNLLKDLVSLQLQILRQSAEPKNQVAHAGFYQQPLDPRLPCQLVRVILPTKIRIYPEISVGKHRLCVRFMHCPENINDRTAQTSIDIDFRLQCCQVHAKTTQTTALVTTEEELS